MNFILSIIGVLEIGKAALESEVSLVDSPLKILDSL